MATKKAALEPQHRWWHNWAIKWLFNKQADLLPYPFLGPVTPCEQSEGSSVVSCEVRDALLSTWRKPPGFSYHYIKLSDPSTDVCLRRLTCFRKKNPTKKQNTGKVGSDNFLTCSYKHHYRPRKMTEEKYCSSSHPNLGIKTESWRQISS